MKILQINKFLYQRGGAETYLFALTKLLIEAGHEVIYFSQKNSKNISNNQEKYFIDDLDLGQFSFSTILRLGRIFWSFKAAKNLKKLIIEEQPDLIHLHNIYHQLSPSIIATAKSFGLPIVMTVHDFKLITPNYTLRADQVNKKHRDSLLIDLLLKLEFAFHQVIKIYQQIDLFIAPSQFVKDKLIEHGYPANKIIIIPHFIEMNNFIVQETNDDYILAFGRLDESKGFTDLIKAINKLGNQAPLVKIVGTGPQESQLQQLIKQLNLSEKIQLLGQKNKTELTQLIANCKFVCLPTRVHETFSLTTLESLAYGKPIIASRTGALPELITDKENGLLIEPNNIDELASAIIKLQDNNLCHQLSLKAKESATNKKYSPQFHLQSILKAYSLVKK